MKISLAPLACLALLAPACIFVADDTADGPMRDDVAATDGASDSDPNDDATTADDGADSTGGVDGDTGDSSDGTGAEFSCSEEILGDPGFEAGSPSEAWAEASELFGSPLCDASCTEDDGAGPLGGQWFAWFGGSDQSEQASLSQSFSITGDRATLGVNVGILSEGSSSDDVLRLVIDETEVFSISAADAAQYEAYTEVLLDVDAWADGVAHTLTVQATLGGGDITSFFVDDLSLIVCSEIVTAEDTGTDPDETGAEETAGSESGSGSDSGTSGEGSSGGSSEGTSSGSDGGSGSGSTGEPA